MLWNVGAIIDRPQSDYFDKEQNQRLLSDYGQVAEQAILSIPQRYPAITVEDYAVMPNHIHLLLLIQNERGRAMHAPTISIVVQQLKGSISKKLGVKLWQRSFHDHIIRNQKDHEKIREYIENNPITWQQDCFFSE